MLTADQRQQKRPKMKVGPLTLEDEPQEICEENDGDHELHARRQIERRMLADRHTWLAIAAWIDRR